MFSMSMMASSTTTPDGDHEPGEDHGVDRAAAQVEHQRRGHQRQRDGHEADQRGAPLEEEGDQHQDHEQAADAAAPGSRLSIDVSMKVAGRKIVGVDLDAGQAGPQLVQRLLDPAVTSSVLAPGELLDDRAAGRGRR